MPGLFGYYDPKHLLPPDAAERMARILHAEPSCSQAIARIPDACIGVVDRGIFPGTSAVRQNAGSGRRFFLQGAVLAFADQDESAHVEAEADRAFGNGLTSANLARTTGTFAAMILDEKAQCVELVTDRQGAYPLYLFSDGDVTLFATQQKAILATGYVRATIDPVAVAMMLQVGFAFGDRTLLESIRVVEPGSIVRISRSGVASERYHRLVFDPDPASDWDREVDHLGAVLRRAVERTVLPNVSTGVPISGGLDSRTILGLTPDPSRFPTFTFGTEGCRDLRYGADLAAALGSKHHAYLVDPGYLDGHLESGVWLTEGLLAANHFHILPHVPRFAEHCSLVLDGIGGDVILGGKYVKPAWSQATDFASARDAMWRWLATVTPAGAAKPMPDADAMVEARTMFGRLYDGCGGCSPQDRVMPFLLENRTRRVIGCGMDLLRHRVEALHPFFDSEFVDAVARIPHAWRRRSRLHLAILKRACMPVARVRWQHTNIPASAPFRANWLAMAAQRGLDIAAKRIGMNTLFPRREMSDFSSWFRGPLRDLVSRVLLDDRTCDRGIVDADLVRSTVRDHLSGAANRSMLLGVLLTLETFCRSFVDEFDMNHAAAAGSQNTAETIRCDT